MKLKQKLMALFTLSILVGGNVLPVGNQVIAAASEDLANQNSTTNNANVEFNAYLEGNTHETTFNVEEGGKMYIELKVKENGYLKNGIVEFNDANYKIDVEKKLKQNGNEQESENSEENNEIIQNIEENKVVFTQVNSSEENHVIELPIKINKEESIMENNFLKTSEIKFIGSYIDGER